MVLINRYVEEFPKFYEHVNDFDRITCPDFCLPTRVTSCGATDAGQ